MLMEGAVCMNSKKYIGMDVHQATISVAVRDSSGKVIMESIIETKAATILEFIRGLNGSLSVTFEEGTGASWLYDLHKPQVTELMVCDPRKNALLKGGNKTKLMPESSRSFCAPACCHLFTAENGVCAR
jgi:hypothetical protein